MNLGFYFCLLGLFRLTQSDECEVLNQAFQIEQFDRFYYMFSRNPTYFSYAYSKCRNMNGHLTDLNENKTKFFQHLVNEGTISNERYWIGLLWTPSLKNQVWDSGRRYTDRKNELPWFPSVLNFYCMVLEMKSGTREWKSCNDPFNYICMLDIGNVPMTQNDTINNNTCLLINNVLSGTSTPPEVNTTDDIANLTTPIPCLPNTNATHECVNDTDAQDTDDKRKYECQNLDQSESVTKDEILVLVLAVILTASLIANIVTGIVICFVLKKYRNLNKEKLRAISMIDILNVDSSPMPPPSPEDFYTDVNQDTPTATGNIHTSCTKKNSASLYYSDVDKHKDSSTETAVDDTCYTQTSRQTNTDDYEASVPGAQSSRDERSSYSHLHETNGHASAVYGIESASDCLNAQGISTSDGQNRDVQVIVLEQEYDAADELYCNA